MLKNLFLFFFLVSFLFAENAIWIDSYRGEVKATGEKLKPYLSINEALIQSKNGDILQTFAGNYSENILVDKPLKINNVGGTITLIGNGSKLSVDYQKENVFHSPDTIAIGPNFVLRENDHITIVSGHSIQILTTITIPKNASLRLLVDPSYPLTLEQRSSQTTKTLKAGETVVVKVEAKNFWGATGIHLEKGATYSFVATGEWVDWYIESSADGFEKDFMKIFEPLRRAPKEKWFSLIGSIDKDKGFLLGKKATVIAQNSGELFCFANDVRFFYWNNKGSLKLTITKEK